MKLDLINLLLLKTEKLKLIPSADFIYDQTNNVVWLINFSITNVKKLLSRFIITFLPNALNTFLIIELIPV